MEIFDALFKALVDSLLAAHRQQAPHARTPGLCQAIAIFVGVRTGHSIGDLTLAIERAATRSLADLNKTVTDEPALFAAEMLDRHTSYTAADGVFAARSTQ